VALGTFKITSILLTSKTLQNISQIKSLKLIIRKFQEIATSMQKVYFQKTYELKNALF